MRTHEFVGNRRRGPVARLLAGVAAMALLAACADRPSPAAPEAGDPLIDRLVEMGAERGEIEDRGDHFVVEGDVRVNKADLRAAVPDAEPRAPGHPSYQRYNTTVAANRRTVRVNLTAVANESASWAAATRAAMANWTAVAGSNITFVETTPADITVSFTNTLGACDAALGAWPASGAPGTTVTINRAHIGFYTQAQQTWIMTHELGHNVGLTHTDGSFGTLIPGTPTSDLASVMNSGAVYPGCPPAAPAWSALSANDVTALNWLYPNPPLSVSISGKQYVARHESAPYTATPANGTAPYTYEWRTRQTGPSIWGSWSGWFSTGSSNVTYASINSCGLNTNYLEVRVTDAVGAQATGSYTIYITNPC
jgi:Dual-action HEIGH metallo-peptidase